MKKKYAFLIIAVLLFTSCTGITVNAQTPQSPRIAAYYTNDTPGFNASDIKYNKLTHIFHAFMSVSEDGTISAPAGYLNPELIESAHKVGVKVLATLGGPLPNVDQTFKLISKNPKAIKKLAQECERVCRKYGYDGIDINWEFPESIEEKKGNSEIVKAIKEKFLSSPAPAPSWLLTLAIPGGDWYARWYDYTELSKYVDFYNLMAFVFHGPWSGHLGHNSNLYTGGDPCRFSCASIINYTINLRKVPAEMVNLGLGFYGENFKSGGNLFDKCGTCSMEEYFYNKIPAMIGKGWTPYWDEAASAPYLKNDNGDGFLTYDNPRSIKLKLEYALNKVKLGGVFIWKLGLDMMPDKSQPLFEVATDR